MENFLLKQTLESFSEKRHETMPVAWFEGLQLLPQHFQSMVTYVERLIYRSARGGSAYHWGLDGIEYDPLAIRAGKFRVLKAWGLFPDGMLFHFDALDAPPLEFDFSGSMVDGRVRLCLSLPKGSCREGATVKRRFEMYHGDPVPDQTNPDDCAVIARLMPRLQIRTWHSMRSEYTELPVVDIVKKGDSYATNGFHPPAIRLAKGSDAYEAAVRVISDLRAITERLQGHGLPDTLPTDYSNAWGWIFLALASELPCIEALISDNATHPRELLLALCSSLGSVAALKGEVPPIIPPYDHFDPGASILAVCDAISGALPVLNLAQHGWLAIPFSSGGGGVMRVVMPSSFKGDRAVLMLELIKPDDDGLVLEWIKTVLIAQENDFNHCRKLRIKGLPRREVFGIDEYRLVAANNQRIVIVDGFAMGVMNENIVLAIDSPPENIFPLIRHVSLIVKNNA